MQQQIPVQFAFEYEVVIIDPDTQEETVKSVWTVMKNKDSLKGPNVKEVRLKQNTKDDTRN